MLISPDTYLTQTDSPPQTSRFTSINHDIRSSLTGIKGRLGFVDKKFYNSLSPLVETLNDFVNLESNRYQPSADLYQLIVTNSPEDSIKFLDFFTQACNLPDHPSFPEELKKYQSETQAKPFDLYCFALLSLSNLALAKINQYPDAVTSLMPGVNQDYFISRLQTFQEMVKDSKMYFEGPGYQPILSPQSPVLIMNAQVADLMELTQNGLAEINYQYPIDQEFQIVTDPLILKHVFLNLLTNADKYGIDSSDKKQPITITIDHVDGETIISVADQGLGMSQVTIDNILKNKKPGRGMNVKNSSIPGTGFGLVQAVEFVTRQLHGSVDIDSELGKGTTVTLHLPDQ